MGYMRHHAILVSGWRDEYVQQARDMAVSIFSTVGRIETIHDTVLTTDLTPDNSDRGHLAPLVSDIVSGATNGYSSFSAFFVAPDGSKEWWDTSDAGDRARERFVAWLESDDAPYLDWMEVQYGDEKGEQRILHASNFTAES
jgi:hypothetical protein